MKVYVNNKNHLLKIHEDPDPTNPLEFEETIHISTFHNHYKSVTPLKHNSIQELINLFLNDDIDQHNDLPNSRHEFLKELTDVAKKNHYYILPITLTDHSNHYYSIGLKAGWDNSFVGFAWTQSNLYHGDEDHFENEVNALLDAYNQYLNETSYYYSIVDENNIELDSCGGIYGNVTENFVRNGLNGCIPKDNTWVETEPIIKYKTYEMIMSNKY